VLNRRDELFEHFRSVATGCVVSYGVARSDCDVRAEIVEMNLSRMVLRLATPDWTCDVSSELIGRFNAENICAAASASWALGISPELIVEGIKALRRPEGRLQLITVPGGDDLPTCLVDYAHTPHALKTVLETLRPLVRGRLITVFGCGGNRDAGKRPLMGKYASALSDYVVVTTDNSRFECPGDIVHQILAGVPETNRNVDVVFDRRKAIACALGLARGPRDVVLLLGKGHESGQIERGIITPFDDRQVARDLLFKQAETWRQVA
jgi:UDP-N-acetylmuramoyl-L-alanyl-D-glutamate--2,6-diaminopimelate ligase